MLHELFVKSKTQRKLALAGEWHEVPWSKHFSETVAPFKLGQRTARVVIDVIAVDQLAHSLFSTDFNGFGNESVAKALIRMLHHG